MKKSMIYVFLFFSFTQNIICTQEATQPNIDQIPRKCERCRQEEEKEVSSILSSFLGVICSFLNILQAPNDKQNVRLGITGMIAGMGNIVNTAIKGGTVVQKYIESDEFEKQVKKIVATKSRSINE